MRASLLPPRALVNVALLGAALRALTLGVHSLWLDEGATWSWATRPTWGGTVFAEANHPPLWWVVTRLWTSAFGTSEAALRAPAALVGIATVVLAWFLGLRLLDPNHAPRRGGFVRGDDGGAGRRAAAWFTGLVAVSAYLVEYAQEARMYAALIAEAIGLSLLYLRWLDGGGRGREAVSSGEGASRGAPAGGRWVLMAYAVLAALALHTHYFAAWVLAAHAAHAVFVARATRRDADRVRALPFLAAVAAAGVLFLPWFAYLVGHYERIATGRPYDPFSRLLYVVWRVGAGPGLAVVDRQRLAEGVGSTLAEEGLVVGATALAWFVPLGIGASALRRMRGTASFVAANLLVPVGLVLAAFPWFPLVHERYLVFLAPWLLLVATVGALRAPAALRPVLLGGLVLLSATGLAAHLGASPRLVAEGRSGTLEDAEGTARHLPVALASDPDDRLAFLHHGHPYGKEPWRQARDLVRQMARPGDLVLLAPDYLRLVWDYYDRGATERLLLPGGEAPGAPEVAARWGEALRSRKRVFLVLAHEETADPDAWFHRLREALADLWLSGGPTVMRTIPPIDLRRSWGVRVAIFDRG